jgi:hypothetical protein
MTGDSMLHRDRIPLIEVAPPPGYQNRILKNSEIGTPRSRIC